MTVGELITKLQTMQASLEVKRLDWVCGGETHHDWQEAMDIREVLPPGNEHDARAVVLK